MFRSKKCEACARKVKGSLHVLEIRTSSGISTMNICDVCADFLEGTQKIMKERHVHEKDSD